MESRPIRHIPFQELRSLSSHTYKLNAAQHNEPAAQLTNEIYGFRSLRRAGFKQAGQGLGMAVDTQRSGILARPSVVAQAVTNALCVRDCLCSVACDGSLKRDET